jgi:hypothetical protein
MVSRAVAQMMTDGTDNARVADLERQVAELSAQLAEAQRESDIARDAARDAQRRAREVVSTQTLRADVAALTADVAFTHLVLASSSDCIKVLGLDGALLFMRRRPAGHGGRRLLGPGRVSVARLLGRREP